MMPNKMKLFNTKLNFNDKLLRIHLRSNYYFCKLEKDQPLLLRLYNIFLTLVSRELDERFKIREPYFGFC